MNITPFVTHIEGIEGLEILTGFADNQSGMLLCVAGQVEFTIGSRHYEMKKGDMLIRVPFINLTFDQISENFKGLLCIVDLEFVFSAVPAVNLSANRQFLILHPLSHPSSTDTAVLISLINLIEQRNQFTGNRPLSVMATETLFHSLAYLVLDSYLHVNQTETNSSDTRESILMTFHADLSRDFIIFHNVSHYAELQNLTTRYFSTTIKNISGYTPLYWINTAISAEAKRLMRNSKMSIKEISYELNFGSPTFFTRWYRNFTGETPSQYRSRCRITLSED